MLFAAVLSHPSVFLVSIVTPTPPFRQGHVVASPHMDRQEYMWNELAHMHLVYGAALGNAAEARRIYHKCHTNQKFTFTPNGYPQFEEEVLHAFEESTTTTSTRKVARQIGVDRCLVWNVLKDDELHPYHKQRVQALSPGDYPLRVAFCDWFLAELTQTR
ncbi:hypothetical protein PR048_011206 [Dryococelus australis]|uniref:Uncharacterized protein n=1 Tax=Dryococelus australis TaxID=614101 RepID=A0ABQ9HLF1_9NEOP|nr:hypothetical protein PR048_011206 [Dryococelus australis]